MHNLKQQYAPVGSVDLGLNEFILEPTVSTTVGLVIDGLASDRAKGRLRKALAVGAHSEGRLRLGLNSKLVRTYGLEQHSTVFSTVVGVEDDSNRSEGIRQVRELLKSQNRAYMVVGLKTAADPDVTLSATQTSSVGGCGHLPIGAITGDPGTLDPQVEVSLEREAKTHVSSQGSGEQIFAIKYCVVKLEKRLEIEKKPGTSRLSARLKNSPALKGLQRHGKRSEQVLALVPNSDGTAEYTLEQVVATTEDEDLFVE